MKGWISESIEKTQKEGPKVADLVSTGDRFDPSRSQALVFNLIVGVYMLQYLLAKGSWKSFEAGTEYPALIGSSQAVYGGAKALSPLKTQQFETEIKTARMLEADFMKSVSAAWRSEPPSSATRIPEEPEPKPVPSGGDPIEKKMIEAEIKDARDNSLKEQEEWKEARHKELMELAKTVALNQYDGYVA
jgi:hypothetical protein